VNSRKKVVRLRTAPAFLMSLAPMRDLRFEEAGR